LLIFNLLLIYTYFFQIYRYIFFVELFHQFLSIFRPMVL
jgi:hypothetical protein